MLRKQLLLQTLNPGKGSLGIPYHTDLPFWIVLPSLLIFTILIAIAVYKHKKERSGRSKAALEEKAMAALTGKKHKMKRHHPSTKPGP